MTEVTRPTMVDDDGTFTSGTEVDKAFVDSILDEVDDQVHSSTNPTIKPKATTDEVVAARGSKATLDARLDVSLEEDGTLKTQASLASIANLQAAFGAVNLVGNDDFQIWPDGDSAAPVYWTLAGAGASVARTGTGLGDTNRKVNDFSVKLTRAAADVTLTQDLLTTTSYDDIFDSAKVGFGCWVKTSLNNSARIQVSDGATTTESSYHTGDGTWQWLSLNHTISASATKLSVVLRLESSAGDAYYAGVVAMFADSAPSRWSPCPVAYGFLQFDMLGAFANTTSIRRSTFHRAGIIKDVQAYLKTAGTTINFDVLTNSNDTPTFESALSATLALSTGKFAGTQSFHATYARRCLRGAFGTSPSARSLVSIDVSNVAGSPADGLLAVRVMVYSRPLERFLAFNE